MESLMSTAPVLPLERQLISILARNREDSFATQRKRCHVLSRAARMIHERFGLQKWENLKAKHIADIVGAWKLEDRGRRGIEEKLSHLRWLVRKIGKANLVPRTNAKLGVPPGPRHTRAGKVIPEDRLTEMLAAVPDERVRAMMLLARYLGLRFKEAALFRPGRDWQEDRVFIKRGTKGGRPRYLWLYHDRQREVLEAARRLAHGDAGIIPEEAKTFEEWRQHVYRVLRAAGIGRATDQTFHDLRRTYFCERMKYLFLVRGMALDRAAALVAREAGHHREEILRWYLADANMAPPAAPGIEGGNILPLTKAEFGVPSKVGG
jgi:site-specific recombinase XerC